MVDFDKEESSEVTLFDTAENKVYVFGSNKLGVHSEGFSKYAHRFFGAVYGCGEGMRGRSYALPTKKTPFVSLPFSEVKEAVERFLVFAREHPQYRFMVARSFAGFHDQEMASLFRHRPDNVELPDSWET